MRVLGRGVRGRCGSMAGCVPLLLADEAGEVERAEGRLLEESD